MSKELVSARPDHTGGRVERLLISVAKEIALGMREAQEICDTHGIDLATLERMRDVPLFQKTVEDYATEINATQNVAKRIRLKARYTLEQALPSAFEMVTDPNLPGPARVKALEVLAKIAGVMSDGDGIGPQTAVGFVNIDFGMLPPAAVTVRQGRGSDIDTIDHEAAPVPEDEDLDADLAQLLDSEDVAALARARRLRQEALLPGHGYTAEELNTGAAPVPGFDHGRLRRPIPDRAAFSGDTLTHYGNGATIAAAEATPAPASVDDDLLAIQI